MTNLLDLVPSLERHLRVYRNEIHTDSKLAGYISDAVEALAGPWANRYAIIFTAPSTYVATPDIAVEDKRPIIVMSSIIYKMGNFRLAAIRDGDFSYDPFPRGGAISSLALDIAELEKYVPKVQLALASSASLRGFDNIFNRENYDYTSLWSLLT